MPQQKKRKSAEEILGITPAPRRSAEEILGISPQQPADQMHFDLSGGPPSVGQPQQPPPGIWQNFKTGAAQAVGNLASSAERFSNAVGSAAGGDFNPLLTMGESAVRGAFDLLTSGDPSFAGMSPANQARLRDLAAQANAAQAQTPAGRFIQERNAVFNAEAAQDPSLSGRIARGAGSFAVGAIPYAAAGLAGGGLPAMAGIAALESAGQPENLALNVGAAAALPVAAEAAGKFVVPILRRIRGALPLRESGAGAAVETAPAVAAEKAVVAESPLLSKAIGKDAFDGGKVKVAELGLEHTEPPTPMHPANAVAVPRTVSVDDITLGRDELSKGRMFQVQKALEQGVKAEGETFTTLGGKQQKVTPIDVVPDPAEPGKFIVAGDGNHRVALLKLQGNTEPIPVKSYETPTQSATVNQVQESMVQSRWPRQLQAPLMRMPENPNPVQQAGVLPRVLPDSILITEPTPLAPRIQAETGPPALGAAPSISAATPGATVRGPSAQPAALELNAPTPLAPSTPGQPPPELTGNLWKITPEQQALFAGAPSGPREALSFGRAAGNAFRTVAQANRTLRTVFDLSAPLNQGAVLSRAHPILAVRAGGQMLRSLLKKQSAIIDDAILNDPFKKLGDQFDMFVSTGGAPEEAFMLKQLNKAPIVGWSERTYRTYLDILRLSVWKSYVKSLQSMGYFPENAAQAYRQAAQFINIATGRGSLKAGGKLDKAMALGGDVLFAPRNLAAKFQLLDPVRYMTLQPGARKLVLRDAITSFGSILGTATLLSAAGVKVGMNMMDDDFLTAHSGNHRYDLTGGLKTEVRFLARMVAGLYNKATGEGNLPADEPLNVASNYAIAKLTPTLGTAYTAIKGTDIKGQKMADKSAAQIAIETFAPMTVEDFYDAYQDSGAVGMLKSSPTIIGQRISVYPERAKAAFLDTPDALRTEQKKAGEPRWFLQPRRAQDKTQTDETPEQFAARLDRANSWVQEYGQKLVASLSYQNATDEQQKAAREYLKHVIMAQSSQAHPQIAARLSPQAIIGSVRTSEAQKAAKKRAEALRR